MKVAIRFIIPLVLTLAAIAFGLAPIVEDLMIERSARDLDLRGKLVKTALQESMTRLLSLGTKDAQKQLLGLFERTTQDERLLAIGVCTSGNQLLLNTKYFPSSLTCDNLKSDKFRKLRVIRLETGDIHVAVENLRASDLEQAVSGNLEALSLTNDAHIILIHDMSFASKRSHEARIFLTLLILGIATLVSLVTVGVARWSLLSWVRSVQSIVEGVKHRKTDTWVKSDNKEFFPILRDLKDLVRDMDRSMQEKDESQFSWNAKSLKEILTKDLLGEEVIVVSNRQPYIHNKRFGKIEVQSPASGLVTAVEPILRACSGVWVAHGNGSADREVVDKNDHVRVPPDDPQYSIHRVWLTKEEELGYYYGFSNEGLWPLCHIAHTRPTFRKDDWEYYVSVNEKFSEAVLKNAKSEDPVIFVHDYHFALLPRILREKLPRATIITFWHIPWPNPESFGICPWRSEILQGLLGSSIIGFHTKYHCNNFIDAVDRYLECRVDRETESVSFQGGVTDIKPYPISIEWPPIALSHVSESSVCSSKVRSEENIGNNVKIGIGVDRLDYTKGIIERFRAVERLFELDPSWRGRFTFIQIAAPSRSSIEAYQNFDAEVRHVANQINTKYGSENYVPILLKIEHHEPRDVYRYLRAADVCVVTSLHDGMNLVAKEFVASRDDEQGVLILSLFAGASRELVEALIVNPYDIEQTSAAIKSALEMSEREQRERMRALRTFVREYNVFRWAGRMLLDASRVKRKTRFAQRINRLGGRSKG